MLVVSHRKQVNKFPFIGRLKMGVPVLKIGWDLVKLTFPSKRTSAKLSAYGSLRVNLLLLDCAKAFSPEMSRKDTEAKLQKFVEELGISMNSDIHPKNALNKDEMKVSCSVKKSLQNANIARQLPLFVFMLSMIFVRPDLLIIIL